jgi:hypothetical protein
MPCCGACPGTAHVIAHAGVGTRNASTVFWTAKHGLFPVRAGSFRRGGFAGEKGNSLGCTLPR